MAKEQKVYYFEYYPHTSGTMTHALIASMSVLKKIQTLLSSSDEDGEWDEAEDLAENLGESYFLSQALGTDDGSVHLNYLSRCKNKSKGGIVEEGSFGFSLTSAKAAKKACMIAESAYLLDEEGW